MLLSPSSMIARVAAALAAGLALVAPACVAAQPAPPRTSPPPPAVDAAPAATEAPKPATDIFETIEHVAVTLRLPAGKTHTGDMVVTHFRPAGVGPFPAIVINHGRAAAKRGEPARWRYLPIVRYWTRRGFAVFVPTRVGYGELGQAVDPEYSGVCANPDYGPAVEAMATQIAKAAEVAGGRSWVDPRRILLLGVSYGGVGVIAASAKRIPGLVGAINFSGGLGGNPERRPGDPCQATKIGGLLGEAGAHNVVPTLWLYADNDKYWGADWPRRWHEAYTTAGGKAQLVSFPPIGDDGHKMIGTGFAKWRPVVDRYLDALGFVLPVAVSKLPDSAFARLEEVGRVPYVKEPVRTEAYTKFLNADVPRAFAISPTGAWAWRSGLDAVDVALQRCQIHAHSACRLYAVDDRVVWKAEKK